MNKNNEFLSDNARWQAVLSRDTDSDGLFVYAVRSTGIYCRPTCPSRRPNRAQVIFFSDHETAREAGFRACKRCQPDAQRSPTAELVVKAQQVIETALAEGLTIPSLTQMADKLSVSPYHLQRTFLSATGVTPRQYAAAHRALKMKSSLRAGNPVTQSMYDAGYGSSSRLYESTRQTFGMRPKDYQRKGAGMQITYTIFDTPPPYSGCMLLAATPGGVCAVQFGDQAAELEDALMQEFSRAEIRRDDDALLDWATILRNHLKGMQPLLNLPLDVQGTAFQQRVWAELRRIPYGQTRTYAQVAEAIQQPSAARAVAHACATNPAALVTPCHRVVRSGGALAGYRWGIQRKKALIENERQNKTGT